MSEAPKETVNGGEKLPLAVPDEVLDQGTRATFKYLQQGMPRASIPRNLAQVEEHGREGVLWSSNAAEEEASTITTTVVENIWKDMFAWIKENPQSVGVQYERGMYPSPPGTPTEYNLQRNLQAGINDLESQLLLQTISPFVKKYCETQMLNATDDGAMQRLQDLLVTDKQYRRFEGNPYKAIMSGFGTASNIICGVLGAIPQVYERQYGEPITAEAYRDIAASARDFVQFLAGIRLDMLFSVAGKIRYTPDNNPYATPTPVTQSGCLQLVENGKGPRIDFTRAALASIGEAYLKKRQGDLTKLGTGCPAMFAQGSDGNNVIGDFYDWYLSFIEKYYVASLPKATNER